MADDSDITGMTQSPRPQRRPAGLANRIPDWPVQAEITPQESLGDGVRLPYIPFPGEAGWMRPLSSEDVQILRSVAGIEGGFTDTHIDGETTLFGVTAATLSDHAQTYLGGNYSEAEVADYMRWMAEGLVARPGATVPPEGNMTTRTTEPAADATALQLEHLAFFHDQLAPSLYYNQFIEGPGFDGIRDPEMRELIASVSINKGPTRAAYVLDSAAYSGLHIALPVEGAAGTNPSTNGDSVYRGNDPEYTTEAVVERYNHAVAVMEEQGLDPAYMTERADDFARGYYEELAQGNAERTRFLNGWLNRLDAHRDNVIDPAADAVTLVGPYEARIGERMGRENAELRANEHHAGAPFACITPEVERDVMRSGELLREHVSGQVIHTETAELCDIMQGRAIPRGQEQASGASADAPSRG